MWPVDAAGTPVDLTGYTARAEIRAVPWEAALLALDSEAGGGIELGGEDGTITLVVPPVDTAALPTGSARWDLFLGPVGGETVHLLTGMARIREPVVE